MNGTGNSAQLQHAVADALAAASGVSDAYERAVRAIVTSLGWRMGQMHYSKLTINYVRDRT